MTWQKPYDEQVDKMPRRFFWTKLIGIPLAIMLAATAGVRIWWGWQAQTRLQRAIAAIRAAGEPVTRADLAAAAPHVDPTDDCMRLYRQASKIANKALADNTLPTDKNGHEWCDDLVAHRERRRADAARVRNLLTKADEAFALIRSARSLREMDFNIDYSKRMFDIFPASLHGTGSLLALAAIDAADRRQDAAAMEYLHDMLVLGDRQLGGPGVLSLLSSMNTSTTAITQLENILPTLRIDGTAGAAAREQVDAMIHLLLDDSAVRPALYRVACWQRVQTVDIAEYELDPREFDASSGWLVSQVLRPASVEDEAIALDSFWNVIVEKSKQLDYPAFRKVRYPSTVDDRLLDNGRHWLLGLLISTRSEDAYGKYFSAIATRRLAATALAIHLYDLDHGSLPVSLDQLVPAYLPSVPIDPFSASHAPILFAPDEHPRVYSVYIDGSDDHGAAEAKWPNPGVDLVFFVKGGRPNSESATSATQPASDQEAGHPQP